MSSKRPMPRLFVVRHGIYFYYNKVSILIENLSGETEWSQNGSVTVEALLCSTLMLIDTVCTLSEQEACESKYISKSKSLLIVHDRLV